MGAVLPSGWVTRDAAVGWQSPAGRLRAAGAGKSSMAKEGKEMSVARINGDNQEQAQADHLGK